MARGVTVGDASERVFAVVAGSPGLSTSRVAALAGYADASRADYHLRRLAKAGRVRASRDGRENLWFPVGMPREPEVVARARPALRANEAAQQVVKALAAAGEAGAERLHVFRATTAPYSQVAWAMESLMRRGIVRKLAWGRYALAPDALRHLPELTSLDGRRESGVA